MVVNSNTLVQFTSSIDTILEILKSKGFWPRYCIEFGWRGKGGFDLAVPQCCFCDIPFTAIQPHMSFYGNYGIGMTKKWGISKGIAPVFYVVKDSSISKSIIGLMKSMNNTDSKLAIRPLAFFKRYKGVNYRKKDGAWKKTESYLYYNEREWRYVPELGIEQLFLKVYNKDSFDITLESKRTKHLMCTFEASDVKYIIVKDDEERMKLISEISQLTNWNDIEKANLNAKIITHSIIYEDI